MNEVFDLKKYKKMTENEMKDDAEFIGILVQKQSFSVLIEDIFPYFFEKVAPELADKGSE